MLSRGTISRFYYQGEEAVIRLITKLENRIEDLEAMHASSPERRIASLSREIARLKDQLSRQAEDLSLAPLEIREAVFQELIRISPASNYMEELATGPGGLLSRGLLEHHATSYGALPRTKQDRAVFDFDECKKLLEHPTASEQTTNFVFSGWELR